MAADRSGDGGASPATVGAGDGAPRTRELRLLGRAYCHLCEDMATALAPLLAGTGWTVRLEDVDADPVLAERYDTLVPVLLDGDRELCHWHLDVPAVRAYLAALR